MLRRPVIFTVIGIIPMAMLALLRGSVGTDTPLYVSIIQEIQAGNKEAAQIFEPLFEALLNCLAILPLSAYIVLAIVSLLTIVLLITGWVRLEPTLVLFALIYAQFFVDMTMNGVRYGLAFSVVVFAARFMVDKRMVIFWVLVASASFIQISGAFLGILLYLLHEQRWRSIVAATVFALPIWMLFNERVQDKFLAYEQMQSPGEFSGAAPLVATILISGVWIFDKNARHGASLKILTLITSAFIFFSVSRVSYAGLRFQFLVLFLCILAFACHIRGSKIELRRHTVLSLILIGVLMGGLKLRNFSETGNTGGFIPYKFIWEEDGN